MPPPKPARRPLQDRYTKPYGVLMTQPAPFAAIIVAAGKGERSGLAIPKQYALLGGRPLLRWSVEAFARHPACAQIIVVTDDEAMAGAALRNLSVQFSPGGLTRQASVASGLNAVDPAMTPLVMVHDAARPGLSAAVIDRLVAAFADKDMAGAIPALPVADTLARGHATLGETVPREELWRVQTPQAFRVTALANAHGAGLAMDATDDAQLVRANGGTMSIVAGDALLEKVTAAGDLERLERLLTTGTPSGANVTQTGLGFDVHRLVPGDGIWLGGILIPHNQRLLGHSDADVLLHAITDALLGAIAMGDIGEHFPPSDPQWRGASSDQFLAHACALAVKAGFSISHIDGTVMCEAPKVGPHRGAIRARIAEIAGIPLHNVAVKATTTEQLGFTGRGEGIAAMAIVNVHAQTEGKS
jgi:2-C-methyl-D-erythritol 4-phosphate cytidylyltransferase / 2-C-methyl-D-erythritol 2,4-cyclodiphosphate synthase